MEKPITLNVISGFLGAGKTTFIRHFLEALPQSKNSRENREKVVYVVNDFGQAGLDTNLVDTPDLQSYELANGCICCTLKTAFSELLGQIITMHEPDRIIFEPSGLFILSELLSALSGEAFSNRLRVGAIVTLIDAVHEQAQRKLFSPVITNQAAFADFIAISKLDPQMHAALEKGVDILFQLPDRPLILKNCWDFTREEWSQIIDFPARPLRLFKLEKSQQLIRENLLWTQSHPGLTALTIPWIDHLTPEEISERMAQLADGRYGPIIRAKGLFRFDGVLRFFQMVYDRQEWKPARIREVEGEPRLVIIGEGLDRQGILEHLGVADVP